MSSENNSLPQLSTVEIRVLGALIEKSKTTPDYYPMTLNSLTAACNQKSSRNPIVDYSEETVMGAIRSLKGWGLVSDAIGGNSRVNKFKHNFDLRYSFTDGEIAIMCLLFLRTTQTPGELNSNSGRLHEFQSLASVLEALNKLADHEPAFVRELPKRPGQKEVRYTHLFGELALDHEENSHSYEDTSAKPVNTYETRLALVEKELAEVKETLAKLMKELMG